MANAKHYARKSDRNKPETRPLRIVGHDVADELVRRHAGQAFPAHLYKSPSWKQFVKGRGWSKDEIAEVKSGYEKRYNQLRG
jgi:hypothetical protein